MGGYHGLWIDEILKKNNPHIPNIILVEPVPEFYNHLVAKYKNYEKIKVINAGVSTDNNEATKTLYVSNDGSSTNFNENVKSVIQIKTIPIDKILLDNNINQVDLLQINIEGDEYGLMEYMIESNIINKFKNVTNIEFIGLITRDEVYDFFSKVFFYVNYNNENWRDSSIQQEMI